MINTTASAASYDPPLYYTPRQRLIDDVPDHILTVTVPIIAYWFLSLFFHALDISGWKWLNKYRIHDSEEVKKRNLVGRTEVVLAVIFQQVIQTLLGLVWLEEEAVNGHATSHAAQVVVVKGLQRWERLLEPVVDKVLGVVGALVGHEVVKTAGGGVLGVTNGGKEVVLAKAAYFVYWWGIPIIQFFAAMYVYSFLIFPLNSPFRTQVLYRHMAILPPPRHAREQIPLQILPHLASQALCPLCLWFSI